MGLFTPFAYIKNQIAREDPDAVAFLTAAGITDPTITSAINTLVISMKSNGLWTKMIAIYPFVGGTATTHKYNLKNPADTNAAFRLVFSGGITHSSNGLVGNGTNGFYDTFITASTDLSQDDVSANIYIRNNVSQDRVDIGCFRTTPLLGFQLNTRNSSNNIACRINSFTLQTVSNTDSRGFFGISRTVSTTGVFSKNTTQTSAATTSDNPPAFKIFGLCFNQNGTAALFSTRQQAYSSLGQGLSDSELDTYYDIVQAFQTTLGKQV
jgi:hypothetical protein